MCVCVFVSINGKEKTVFFLAEIFVTQTFYPLVIKQAMENGPFEDVFPIKNGDTIAMLVYQSVGSIVRKWVFFFTLLDVGL